MFINDLVISEDELRDIIVRQSRTIANLQRDFDWQKEQITRLETENFVLRSTIEKLEKSKG